MKMPFELYLLAGCTGWATLAGFGMLYRNMVTSPDATHQTGLPAEDAATAEHGHKYQRGISHLFDNTSRTIFNNEFKIDPRTERPI